MSSILARREKMMGVVIGLVIGYVVGGVVDVAFLLAFCMRKMARNKGGHA